MRASLPSSRAQAAAHFEIRSSSGGSHEVTAYQDTAQCDEKCRGFHYRGRCRHADAVLGWLRAVTPPGQLPE